MKRFLSVLLIFWMVFLQLWTYAYAADSTYNIDELGMSIDLANELVVFTRDVKDNDPNLNEYGLTKNDLTALMLERNIYLNAWDKNINYEIVVTMMDSPLADYNQLSDTSLNALIPALTSEFENNGITFIKSELYQHTQAKFVKMYSSRPNNGDTAYILQYNTAYNGKAINITMQSYSGKIDSDKEAILKVIVDTVHFDTEPQLIDPPAPTEAFTYTDQDSGLSFIVPMNWVQAPMTEKREHIDAKFVSNLDEGICILFASEDFWSVLTDSEKRLYSKSDANNALFTKADIAEICGCEESDVSTVDFSGREYFCAEVEATGYVHEFPIPVPMTYLVRYENGYMYMFMFTGTSDSEYYSDFRSLINSTEYPQSSFEDAGKALENYFSPINLIGSLIITIVVYSLPIIIYRFVIVKKAIDKKKAKRITVIYGIIGFLVMSMLISMINGRGAAGGAIFLWSWVNYRILIGGKKAQTSFAANKTVSPIAPETDIEVEDRIGDEIIDETDVSNEIVKECQPTILFCHKCGNKLVPGSSFCSKCGAKISNVTET